MKRIFALCLCLALLLSGCVMPEKEWVPESTTESTAESELQAYE